MKISEILQYLESISPLSLQEEYDNCGLLIGDQMQEFKKALLCLDVTEAVMKEAINEKCNLVISHHPPIFRRLKKLTAGQPESQAIIMAIKNDIALYAMHTNLDNTLNGLNLHLLSKFGMVDFRILSPKEGMLSKLAVFCPDDFALKVRQAIFNAGAGKIGNYDCCSYNVKGEGTFRALEGANPFVGNKNEIHLENETRVEVVFPSYLENTILSAMHEVHPYEEVAFDLYRLQNKHTGAGSGLIGELIEPCQEREFLARVKQILDVPVVRHSAFRSKPVKKIAICTGSGSFLIQEAIRSNADVYLTADLKYHDFFSVENSLLLADIGHYESEKWVKEWLYAVLIEKFPNFAFLISEVNTNPVYYF